MHLQARAIYHSLHLSYFCALSHTHKHTHTHTYTHTHTHVCARIRTGDDGQRRHPGRREGPHTTTHGSPPPSLPSSSFLPASPSLFGFLPCHSAVKSLFRPFALFSQNFQKASCTLDASVMIYSHRVDSVHKDTYKVFLSLCHFCAHPTSAQPASSH
jgi:hypothetical protein